MFPNFDKYTKEKNANGQMATIIQQHIHNHLQNHVVVIFPKEKKIQLDMKICGK